MSTLLNMKTPPINIKSKLPLVGTTIFTVMSALANEHGATNLSQGFPDFSCDEKLQELVYKHIKAGHNQYAPMSGLPMLRELLAQKTEQLYQYNINPDTEITITAGGTQAIYTAINALVHKGDEVIVFEPAYDCYVPAVVMAGGNPITVPLAFPDYAIDWNQVKKLINAKTKMIIINTPHNPTGQTLKKEDMEALEKITDNTDIVILSDEVYEHIIFDQQQHESVWRHKKLAERSMAIYSFGKTYHVTGWKIGYCIAPEYLMKEFRKVHQFLVFSVNTPLQYAIADYLLQSNDYLQLSSFYQEKRDYFLSMIKNSRFDILPSSGTYFQLLSYRQISDAPDTDFAIQMTIQNKLASVPLSVFYKNKEDNKVLRFCFAKGKDTLEKAAEILSSI